MLPFPKLLIWVLDNSSLANHLFIYFVLFFFLRLFILCWGMANQQCCDSFRLTVKGLQSYLYMYLFPNSPPSQAAIEPWADVCSLRVLLVICFKFRSVYVRITHLPALLSPHSPLATTNSFCTFYSVNQHMCWCWVAFLISMLGCDSVTHWLRMYITQHGSVRGRQ